MSATASSTPASGRPGGFRRHSTPGDGLDAQVEVDWYGGIKPTWNSPLGTINLDFGVIYYSYPGATGLPRQTLNYVEFKAGYSWSALHPSLVTGTTVYWSPDYTFETGPVWTIETMAAWTLPQVPRLHAGHQRRARLAEGRLQRRLLRQRQRHGRRVLLLERRPEPDGREASPSTSATGIPTSTATLADLLRRRNFCDERFVFSAKVVLP